MNVTAEGVETAAQASFLRSIECDKQQGYLFSRPVAASAYARSLAETGQPAGEAGVLRQME